MLLCLCERHMEILVCELEEFSKQKKKQISTNVSVLHIDLTALFCNSTIVPREVKVEEMQITFTNFECNQ